MTDSGDRALVVSLLGVCLGGVLLACLLYAPPAEASFPGTNGKVYFESNNGVSSKRIFSVNPDGSGAQELTGTLDANAETNPAVSPDGSRVAYEYQGEVWIMNADGTSPRRLTNPSVGSDADPTWSPDGARIAFTRINGDYEIWTMNADGSEQANLTNNSDNEERDPAWSPLGDKIAYTRSGCEVSRGGGHCVYVMNVDGSSQTNLTPQLPNNDQLCDRQNGTGTWGDSKEPAWSPDGSKIAFTSRPDCTENRFSGTEIWTMNAADGSGQSNVTSDDKVDEHPAFSPDGQRIVFASNRDNSDHEVFTIPVAGGTITQLTNTTSSVRDENPDWAVAAPTCDVTGSGTITGGSGDEVICGSAGNDVIDGGGGDDVILGFDGNDTLIGDAGRVTLNGGSGSDTAKFTGSPTALEASLTSGFAQRIGTSPLEGVALVEVENLIGSAGDDVLEGSNGKNKLVGGPGADELSGLGKADTLNSKDLTKGNDAVNGGPGSDDCVTDRRDTRTSCP